MTTPSATTMRPARRTSAAWLAVIAVFVAGTTIGAVTTSIWRAPAGAAVPAAAEPAGSESELTRLFGNMDAAAQRHDFRMFIEFREDLVELIGSTGIADYQALRGISSSSE